MGAQAKYINQEQKPRDKAEQSKHLSQKGRDECIWRDFHCEGRDCCEYPLYEGGSLGRTRSIYLTRGRHPQGW